MLSEKYDIVVAGPLTICSNHNEIRKFYDQILKVCSKLGYKAYNGYKFTDPYKHPDPKPSYIYNNNKTIVSDARLIIAYVGEPSTGTGQELEIAANHKIPIILVYEKGKKISRMVLGNPLVIERIVFSKFEESLKYIEKAIKKVFQK